MAGFFWGMPSPWPGEAVQDVWSQWLKVKERCRSWRVQRWLLSVLSRLLLENGDVLTDCFFPGNRKMRKGILAKGISPETRRWFCKSTACGVGKEELAALLYALLLSGAATFLKTACLKSWLLWLCYIHTFLCCFSGYVIILYIGVYLCSLCVLL